MKRIILLCFLILGFNLFADDYLARGIILKDGSILEGINTDIKHPISSLTKLMTALVVVDAIEKEQVSLDDIVVVDKKSAGIGGKSIKLLKGDKLSVKELLEASLLASANNATYALASHLAGDEESFVELMNKKAEDLEMTSTKFFTPSGMPSISTNKDADYSTLEDLAKMSAEVLNHKIIMDIVSLKEVKIKKGRITVKNDNKNIDIEGTTGIKWAHQEDSGYNVISSVERNDQVYIVIILGALTEDGLDSELEENIDYVYENYREAYLVNEGELMVEVPVAEAKVNNIYLYSSESVVNLIKKDWNLTKSIYLPKELEAPIKKDEKVGVYVISYEGKELARVDLITKEEVKKGNWLDKILKKFKE